MLHREGLDAYVVRRLNLSFHDVDWTMWGDLLERVHHPAETVRIAVVGKYIDLPDAYLSVTEALRAGGFGNNARVEIVWVASDDCTTYAGARAALSDVQGVLIPGGFGVRGIEGKIGAINFARINKIPVLGLCLGLQCIVIEAARNLAGLGGANSAEFDANAADPVIATMADQHEVVVRRQGHGRHDAAGCLSGAPDTRARWSPRSTAPPWFPNVTGTATRSTTPTARRWRTPVCRLSGTSPDSSLVEFVELDRELHPFLVATQAHPEFKSRPTRPHPLFASFVRAALDYLESERLPIADDAPEPARPREDLVAGTVAR